MTTAQYHIQSEFGSFYLTASAKGLQGIFREKQPLETVKTLNKKTPVIQILSQAAQELKEYFKGTRKKFTVALNPEGTAFQKKVWRELQKIPYAATCSYQDIARKIKKQKASRAVGSANGKNPLCIMIPCHRVIAADGTLGGYSGGLALKKKLLALEQKFCRPA